MQPRPPEESFDLDRTDTLPALVLETDDTGTLAVPHVVETRLPEAQLPRRLRVADDLFSGTDSFTSATLAGPMAAIPVSVPDLAESLREREEMLLEAARREAELEAQLAAMTQRCAELEQSQAAPATPAAAPAAPSRVLLDEIGTLRRTNTLLHESISSLHGRLGVHEAMLAEAEEALRSIEAGAHSTSSHANALPAPVQTAAEALQVDWASRYAELELILEGEREAAASRLADLRAELAAARVAPAEGAAVPARSAGVALRVLVRIENGTEHIHPLGRRTTIGRTPDNDIQVNTTYISRHHAVLLSSAGECIIEDLNSTNGLLVNGQRVGRQILRHGDLLAVGKTLFRYESRS